MNHMTKAGFQRRRDVWQYVSEHPGYSIREVGDAMGISSTAVVAYHLGRLRDAGYVTWESGLARTLRAVVPLLSQDEGELHHA